MKKKDSFGFDEEAEKGRSEWWYACHKTYTDRELAEFHERMQKYRRFDKFNKETGKPYEAYYEDQYLVDQGAISLDEHGRRVIRLTEVERDGYGSLTHYKVPFELYDNELEQWKDWKWRRELAREHETVHWEKLAAEKEALALDKEL